MILRRILFAMTLVLPTVTAWAQIMEGLPLPPEPICGPIVHEAAWSPDGRYILAARQKVLGYRPAVDEQISVPSLSLWQESSRSVLEIWQGPAGAHCFGIEWMPGASVAFLLVRGSETDEATGLTRLCRIDARRGTFQTVLTLEEDWSFSVSPKSTVAYLLDPNPDGATLRRVESSGRLGPPIAIPGIHATSLDWSQDGNTLYVVERVHDVSEESVVGLTYYRFDPATGKASKLQEKPATWRPTEQSLMPFLLISKTTATLEKDSETVRSLWLSVDFDGHKKRNLICADVGGLDVSPRGNGLMYQSRESLFVLSVQKLAPHERAALGVHERLKAVMNRGKQVGIGLMMYALDNDNLFPNSGANVSALLTPYLKTSEILSGFVYEFEGGNLNEIEDPAHTPLGHYDTPDGRVVVYADGHVAVADPNVQDE